MDDFESPLKKTIMAACAARQAAPLSSKGLKALWITTNVFSVSGEMCKTIFQTEKLHC